MRPKSHQYLGTFVTEKQQQRIVADGTSRIFDGMAVELEIMSVVGSVYFRLIPMLNSGYIVACSENCFSWFTSVRLQ
jgi:hypothetical protein